MTETAVANFCDNRSGSRSFQKYDAKNLWTIITVDRARWSEVVVAWGRHRVGTSSKMGRGSGVV